MIEESILGFMLIWIISQIERIRRRLNKGTETMKYFNHKITLIENKLQKCGIILLEDPSPEVNKNNFITPPIGPDLK